MHKMEISLISKKFVFCDSCYPFTGKHLLDVCSSVELLMQDSGINFIIENPGNSDYLKR